MIEDVAEMDAGARARHFHAVRAVAVVLMQHDGTRHGSEE
jgi:hypothetical protein